MNARAKVNDLLAECGAVLKRATKHEIWLLPNGKKFVRAQTPSDNKADANNLSDLKHTLGLVKPQATTGERRGRTVKRKMPQPIKYRKADNMSLADTLRMAGLTDDALRDRMNDLEARIVRTEKFQVRIEALEGHVEQCWACRLWRWRHE